MIRVSIHEVAEVLGAGLQAEPGFSTGAPFPPVSIDSRRLEPGDCFVAVQGQRFDGHDFISQAVDRGARIVIHSKPVRVRNQESGIAFLRVRDTTRALQELAGEIRRRWAGPLAAVTGSMGKTTTRRFAAALLRERFQVCESPGNLNNHFGVPLSLLGLRENDEVAVLELGMNHPGEIRRLSSICRPNVAVLTNVAAVHLEFFESLEEIAAAKAEILEGLQDGGTLLFNGEDERLCEVARRFDGPSRSFGTRGDCCFQVSSRGLLLLEKMDIDVRTPTRRFTARVPFSGKHYLFNIAAATALAATLGLSDAEIERGIRSLAPPDKRGRVLHLTAAPGVRLTLIDESYNSNPGALASVLGDFAALKWKGRKLAVLGDMLELGPRGPELHRETGRISLRGIDLLVTVGDLAAGIGEGAVEGGMCSGGVSAVGDYGAAATLIRERARDGDLVLVKASRGVGLDRMIRILEKTP